MTRPPNPREIHMPANVETMMYAGQVPWHGIGTAIPQDVGSSEAIVLAGLDWSVGQEKVFLADGVEAPGVRAIVRSDNRRVLSVRSEDYALFQNQEMFDFGDALVGLDQAKYHTAGSLNLGSRVWALMKADGGIKLSVGDDTIEKFLLLSTSHDGSLAFSAGFTPVRVVCQNTLSAALRGMRQSISIRHTGKLSDRVEDAKRVLGIANNYFAQFGVLAEQLVRTPYSDAQVGELAAKLFPSKREDDSLAAVVEQRRTEISRLFTMGKGHDRIAGTAWAAYNAVTEFADYQLGVGRSTPEQHLNSVWFGRGLHMKEEALGIIAAQTGLQQLAA